VTSSRMLSLEIAPVDRSMEVLRYTGLEEPYVQLKRKSEAGAGNHGNHS